MKPHKYDPKNETRPEVWVQWSRFPYMDGYTVDARLRILIPGEEATYADKKGHEYICCWDEWIGENPDRSLRAQRRRMRAYDKEQLWPPAEFIARL